MLTKMNQLKNIVVGVDFSNRAQSALFEAARLARSNKSSLLVVHVVEEEAAEALAEHEQRDLDELRTELMADAGKKLRKWSEGTEFPDHTDFRVVYGHTVDELVKQVEQVNADLLAVGVRGTIDDGVGIGAQATRLVRGAPCKVLVVEQKTGPFQQAVACIDFSPTSARVVEQAIHLSELDGCELHFLHIYVGPWNKFHYLVESRYSTEFRKSYLEDLEVKLRAFVGDTRTAKVSFHLQHYQHRGHGISQFAGKTKADLIIIGTRGRTSVKYFLLGSTAEYVLRERPCTVLAVRPLEA